MGQTSRSYDGRLHELFLDGRFRPSFRCRRLGVRRDAYSVPAMWVIVEVGKVDLYYPAADADSYFRWGSMEGASSNYPARRLAIRMKSDIVSWPGGYVGP